LLFLLLAGLLIIDYKIIKNEFLFIKNALSYILIN